MSNPYEQTMLGFSDLGQEPFGDIPTEPEAFLRWAASLDRHQPFKYELSEGKVSRMMIQVSRAHWLVTANILGELLQKLDRTRFQAGPAEFGVRTGVGVRYPDVVVDRASAGLERSCLRGAHPHRRGAVAFDGGLGFHGQAGGVQGDPLGADLPHLQPGRAARLGLVAAGRRRVAQAARGAGRPRGRDRASAASDIELAMAAIFRGIPDAPTPG